MAKLPKVKLEFATQSIRFSVANIYNEQIRAGEDSKILVICQLVILQNNCRLQF